MKPAMLAVGLSSISLRASSPERSRSKAAGDAAVHAVEVVGGAAGAQLDVGHTLGAAEDHGPPCLVLHGSLPEAGVRREELRVVAHEGSQVQAPDLFFALDEELELEGERAVLFAVEPQGLDAGENVALVVRDTPGIQRAVADGRLERFALPELQRFRRLHVVVAVGEERPFAFADLRVDDRVSLGLHDSGLGTGLLELSRDPIGALAKAPALVSSGGDRRHPQELLELAEKVVFQAVHTLSKLHLANPLSYLLRG
jgi:hypothetical protein